MFAFHSDYRNATHKEIRIKSRQCLDYAATEMRKGLVAARCVADTLGASLSAHVPTGTFMPPLCSSWAECIQQLPLQTLTKTMKNVLKNKDINKDLVQVSQKAIDHWNNGMESTQDAFSYKQVAQDFIFRFCPRWQHEEKMTVAPQEVATKRALQLKFGDLLTWVQNYIIPSAAPSPSSSLSCCEIEHLQQQFKRLEQDLVRQRSKMTEVEKAMQSEKEHQYVLALLTSATSAL